MSGIITKIVITNEPGHHKSKCSNPRACSRCGEDHDSKDCMSKVFRCSNCVKHKKEKIDHPAYSSDCPFNQGGTLE